MSDEITSIGAYAFNGAGLTSATLEYTSWEMAGTKYTYDVYKGLGGEDPASTIGLECTRTIDELNFPYGGQGYNKYKLSNTKQAASALIGRVDNYYGENRSGNYGEGGEYYYAFEAYCVDWIKK